MGTYCDVITNMDITNYYAGVYFDLGTEEEAATANLYNVHEDMINNWMGQGGEAFRALAGTIECELRSNLRFSFNQYDVTDKQANNASQADSDRSKSIDVNTQTGSTSGG